MTTNFDSISEDENLDNFLEQKEQRIAVAIKQIRKIFEQLNQKEKALEGFKLVRQNIVGNVFKNIHNEDLQVIIEPQEKPQWIMFLDQEMELDVSGFSSNLRLVLKRRGTGHEIGNLTIEDSESKYIAAGKSTYESFCSIVVDLMNKFDTSN
jgi:hypothetical protein